MAGCMEGGVVRGGRELEAGSRAGCLTEWLHEWRARGREWAAEGGREAKG